MIKNNKGVTLAILTITIIVIVIISGVTIKMSDYLVKDMKMKTQITNMCLIKAKAEEIYEEYQFLDDSDNLEIFKGDKVNTGGLHSALAGVYLTGAEISDGDTNKFWYQLSKNFLVNEWGFDSDVLLDNDSYLINYKTGDVIYTRGFKGNSGKKIYRLTEFLENK